jgi:nitroreductase
VFLKGYPAARDCWERLLETAILAPSPHNVQPWAIRIEDSRTAMLFMDLQRVLPKEDVTGMFLISAMGIFLETLAIVAASENLHLRYVLCGELSEIAERIRVAEELLPIAKMYLENDAGAKPEFGVEHVVARATARMAYESTLVPQEALRRLTEVASARGVTFGSTADPSMIRAIADLNIAALFHDLNDANYHDEIAQWFRCGEKQERKHRDGLSNRCMSMSALELSIAKSAPGLLRVPGLSGAVAAHYRRALATPCMAWLSGDFWEPKAALNSGHTLMRFWLSVTAQGLSLHPMGNLVTNRTAAKQVESITGARNIWIIFKLGYARNVPRSLRRPVADFLR